MPSAIQIFDHFMARADFVTWANKADHVWRNGAREVRRVGTGWSACVGNLHAAAQDGCDLFIAHERPFETPPGELMGSARDWELPRLYELERGGMALMNLHDAWDHFPKIGVRPSLARFLGLGEEERRLD